MSHVEKRTTVRWMAVLIWMVVIFYLSHQPAPESSALSSGLTDWIMKMIDKVPLSFELDLNAVHFFVRKGAHFCAYFLLGLLVSHAVRERRGLSVRRLSLALVVCVVYAISDEIHQLFTPGRSGEVADVLLDTSGSIVGIGWYVLVMRLKKKVRQVNKLDV